MMKDRKNPQMGPKHGRIADQAVDGTEVVANDEATSEAHGPASRSDADRRIEGLLRIIGLQGGYDRDLTQEEAELIFDIAEGDAVSAERLARIRAGVLRRRFGTTPVPDQSVTEESSSVAPSAPEVPAISPKAAPDIASGRPSLVRHCNALKRKLADFAMALRLDRQTLFELDRGAANSVPRVLIETAATTLKLDRDEVARCLAPGGRAVPRMAAHGRPCAQASKPPRHRDFLEVIETSKLPEEEKRYWRQVVAAESATSGRTSENS